MKDPTSLPSLPSLFPADQASSDEQRPTEVSPSANTPAPAFDGKKALEEWMANQPHYPVRRVPLFAIAHFYKGGLGRPPSRLIEPKRKYVRPDWVRIFQEAKAARDAAARADNEAEGS